LYPYPTPLFKIENPNLAILLEAQGELLTVKITDGLKRQQNSSVAKDWKRWKDLERLARRDIVKFGTENDLLNKEIYYRLASEKSSRTIDFIAEGVWSKVTRRSSGRGRIYEFSRKSRLRLLRATARLSTKAGGLFVTFTYRKNVTDAKRAKEHLALMLLWIKRWYPETACIWRMEYQKRGAAHFHVMVLNRRFIPADKLTAHWQKITGDDSYPDIEKIRTRRKLTSYIAKYIAKVTQEPTVEGTWVTDDGASREDGHMSDGAYILAPEQENELHRIDAVFAGGSGLDNVPYSDNYIGRLWGVTNRKMLPLAPLEVIHYTKSSPELFETMRRYARRYWKRMSRRFQGFSLFTPNPYRWLEVAAQTALSPPD
jgi:hypothetical protein